MAIPFCIRKIYSTEIFSTIFLFAVLFPYGDCENGNIRADKNYVGVVFSPYSKMREGPKLNFPAWNTYTMEEVGTELQAVSTKFRNISTYGTGATSSNSTWKTGDADGFTGIEAAKLNKKLSKLAISVSIGVFQHKIVPWLNNEIKTAFDITEEANRIFSGTVWGITLTSHYMHGPDQADQVTLLVDMARNISVARKIAVSLGVRITICERLLTFRNTDYLHKILQKLDYIICIKNPPSKTARSGVINAVKHMEDVMVEIRKEIGSINSKLEVIFETGWPSAGISGNNIPTSTKLMSEYWEGISNWSSSNAVPVYLFSAFDEPWQNRMQTQNRNEPDGPCGAEGHYGWWRRVTNEDNLKSFVEKITEPEFSPCEPAGAGDGLSPGSEAGIALGVIILIFASFTIVILYVKLKKAKTKILSEEEITEFEQGVSLTDEEAEYFELALRIPYDRKFELEKDKFYIDKHTVLGSGAFGIVYKGKIEGNESDVAFKTTKPRCPVENLKRLLSEIKLMIYIGKHENIVGLVAAYTGQLRDGEVYIASEYCAKGSLEKLLRSSNRKYVNVKLETDFRENEKVTDDERYINTSRIIARKMEKESLENKLKCCLPNFVRWSYEIANGMTFLEYKNVIHADLATRNVLLTENGVAKITDFGLSRKLYSYTNYVKKKEEPLPWRWMSIESIKQLSFSHQSDVWSYGITLWEIFSYGDVPYPGLGWDIDFVEKLIRGLRLKKPSDATPEIYTQMANCWNKDPKQRPTFPELADYFFQLKSNQSY